MISTGRKSARNLVRDILHDTYCERPADVFSDDCKQGCGNVTRETVAALVKARLLVLHPTEESPDAP